MNPLVAPIPILVAIGFAIGFMFNYTPDPYAELSIILGAISIGLAFAIFILQQSQNQKISDLAKEQHEMIQKIKEISIQQQQNRKSRLKLALPKIIDELKNLQTSYKSLKRILDDPKREEILTQFEMTSYKRNDSFVTAARIPPLILTTKYAENKMRELFKDIQSDLDRIIMENTINHPHWAWEHFEFCIKNKNNLQLIRDRVDSMDFSVQLQYCDFLIEYYESALADVKSN